MNNSIKMLPSDFIASNNVVDNDYTLEIKDADENIIPDNIIQYSSNIEVYTGVITNKETLNTCWTNFTVMPHTNAHPVARCKQSFSVALNTFGKYYITPSQINNSSTGFQTLEINRSELTCDDIGEPLLIKLSAIGADNVISQCICEVDVKDNLPPYVVMESNFSIVLNSINPYILTPEQVGSYGDNCEIQSLQVIPNEINCDSPNPTTVRLIVTDMGGNIVSATTQVSHTTTNVNMNGAIACNDQIKLEVNPTSSITITPQMVLAGNYSCNSIFKVVLSHNGVDFPLPVIDWDDAGKMISFKVTEENTGVSCWGYIIVNETQDCDAPFVVCDTLCPNGNTGICGSGYTDSDNLDWPCDFDIYICEGNTANQISPEQLEIIHGVPSANVRPQIINYDCPVIYMTYTDLVIGLAPPPSQSKKILRTWNVLNYLNSNLYQYTQIFNVYANGLEICDTLPWNTPFGNCASGHTDTDAIEWPADITVNNSTISLIALRTNPDVHPNNVEPRLIENCSSAYQITYYDVVTNIDEDTKLIERTWNVFNWVSGINSTYVQNITLNFETINQVCAFTYYVEPINDVNMGLGMTDATGCATLTFDPNIEYTITPSKLGNAQDGVDILDIILLYEAVLGFIELNPYQKISADVNRDGAVTVNDLIEFRKFLDGVSTWPDDLVWSFVDKNYDFPNGGLSGIPYYINTKDLIYGNEFVGIKMGDINGSYYQDGFVNSPAYTVLKAEDGSLNNGEKYETTFTSDRNQNLVAVKLEYLIKDKGISVSNVTSDLLPGFDPSKNVVITEDKILISWGADIGAFPQGVGLRNNDPLFKFEFVSNKNSVLSSILELNPEVHNAIKQSGVSDPATVNLHWDLKITNGVSENPLSNLKVQPNPFFDNIQIVGLESDAKYEVADAAGRTLLSGIVYSDGMVDLNTLNNGFYILKISQNDRIHFTHKIIKLQ
ncbi:MAG TPA: T9SS type A sorting domain-containing protein [Saprospiraceae bacterium]|nr:T9SS type A sorting domain-containing protein [Saprospiraceae bacterium]